MGERSSAYGYWRWENEARTKKGKGRKENDDAASDLNAGVDRLAVNCEHVDNSGNDVEGEGGP